MMQGPIQTELNFVGIVRNKSTLTPTLCQFYFKLKW